MECLIRSLNVSDVDGRRISCKVLEILQDSLQERDRFISFVCENDFGVGYDLIVCALLQVDGDKCDGIRDFLGAHEWITGNTCLRPEQMREQSL